MPIHFIPKLFLCLCFYSLGIFHAQAQLKPTKTKAVVTFIFSNPTNQKPVVGKSFTLEGEKNKQEFELTTDTEGKAAVLVPIDDVYAIHLSNWKDFASVAIPKGAYQRHEIPVPFYEIPKDGSPLLVEIPVHIRLVTDEGKPSKLKETLTIRSGNIRKTHTVTTDENGMATLNLPIGCKYMLSLEGAPNYYKFEIPNKPYAAWTEDVLFERIEGMEKYPSINRALFNFIFYDLKGKLVEGERFWVVSEKDGSSYQGMTNKKGIAQILVPLDDVYTLNAAYNLNFGKQEIRLDAGSDIIVETIVYESFTTQEWRERREEQALAAAKRDSIAQAQAQALMVKVDSLKKLNLEDKAIAEIVKKDRPIPIKRTFRIRKAVKAKVEIVEKQIRINPNYFEDAEKPILATLQRFKERWKGSVVVTDITESMNPYLEEVLIWHMLNLRQGEHTKYLFFNDGDKKMASAKKVGNTGGIYACEGAWDELPIVISTMHVAMESGLGGGEPPENDLEAVLEGLKQKKKIDELVLIADSYSRVRDMALLSQINVPIRIILCGAEETNGFYRGLKPDINEEYFARLQASRSDASKAKKAAMENVAIDLHNDEAQ